MKVLITGGAGFIGSHTVRRLLSEGNEVVCVDDFNDYYSPEIKEKNISEFLESKKFTLERCDIRDANKMKKIFKKYSPSHVIHLAARAGVRPSIKDPLLYHEVNIGGTTNVLECARLNGIENMVFASSSSVYGGCKKIPFKESEWPLYPISPYAATKLGGENLCRYYHEQYGMNITCLRFFTVYGPSGRPDMAPYLFTDAIYKGESIKRFGDGTTKRDYTYVSDIVDGVIAAVKKPLGYEIINLGNNSPIMLNDFIATIEKILNRKAKIIQLGEQQGDVSITYADIGKAKKLLNFKPQVKIHEGIKEFVSWYLKQSC
ncbi:MAG: SDR family NAD(P)-dependent oxidoreductase [Candidatus Gracilibacteria bacterium]|jgi:UDP-glucuronate 4-epimerase